MGLGVSGGRRLLLAELLEEVHGRRGSEPFIGRGAQGLEFFLRLPAAPQLSQSQRFKIGRFGRRMFVRNGLLERLPGRACFRQALMGQPREIRNPGRASTACRGRGFQIRRIGRRRLEVAQGFAPLPRLDKIYPAQEVRFRENSMNLAASLPDMEMMAVDELDSPVIPSRLNQKPDLPGQSIVPLDQSFVVLFQQSQALGRGRPGGFIYPVELFQELGVLGSGGDGRLVFFDRPHRIVSDPGVGQPQVAAGGRELRIEDRGPLPAGQGRFGLKVKEQVAQIIGGPGIGRIDRLGPA